MTTSKQNESHCALLLGGGGARAAYQVGVLKALSDILPNNQATPFPVICGTSAGSINTAALASYADDFHLGVMRLSEIWSNFELNHVFHADHKNLFKRILGWAWAHIGPGNNQKGPGSLLDNTPLRNLLRRTIDPGRITQSIESGDLHAFCVTACSYSSGTSTSFYQGKDSIQDWSRNHRVGKRTNITLDHLMASSAITVIFPSVKIGDEHYGDGSMRQISPISPALHLGAKKLLIIGLRMPKAPTKFDHSTKRPSLGQISGYVLDTLFLNSLESDIERMERMNRTLAEGGTLTEEKLSIIDHMAINPSRDISDIAQQHYHKLPSSFRTALKFLGMHKANSRRFISYLMFNADFCRELIELGFNDAMAQSKEISSFLQV